MHAPELGSDRSPAVGPSVSPPAIRVVRDDLEGPHWNRFVEAAGGTVFHLWQWRTIVRRAYGHPAHYLMAETGSRVDGVLPLITINSRLFGRATVSLPFADYGGMCARGAAAAEALLAEAQRQGRAAGSDYLQLRQREPMPELPGSAGDKITMELTLEPDPASIWARLPTERRNRVKKAQRAGVRGRFTDVDALEAFYAVQLESMRDLGSPVHSPEFFRAVAEELRPYVRVLLIERLGEVIGAALCLFFRDTVYIPWVSSLRRHFAHNPNMVLYWTAIEEACHAGYRVLDFGRSSPGTGPFEFKRQWGATPSPLGWRSLALRGGRVPTFSGQGRAEWLLVQSWKRLPLGLTRVLGPRVRGMIPA
jgi:FemAB-related protein (PEP-CTERM system-associated)